MICGGGQMPADVYNEFVRLAAGKKARIVVIPTAKAWPSREDMEGRFAHWRTMRVSSRRLSRHRIARRSQSGRSPSRWTKRPASGLPADRKAGWPTSIAAPRSSRPCVGVLERGGIIGGTSAGAAIMSRMMIRYGSPKAVVDAGFNLLNLAVVDQHFLRRNRQERLLGVLNEHPEMIGLGVDEGTALVVEGDHLRVMGQSEVVVCKSAGAQAPWVQTLKAGEEVDLVSPPTPAPEPLVLQRARRPAGDCTVATPGACCASVENGDWLRSPFRGDSSLPGAGGRCLPVFDASTG